LCYGADNVGIFELQQGNLLFARKLLPPD
jgi:hypothetical protein